MKKYTTLFFDLDDTLLDTVCNSKVSMSEIYDRYQFGLFYPVFEDFYTFYQKSNILLWEQYARGEIKKEDIIDNRFFKLFEPFGAFSVEESRNINADFMENTAKKDKTINGAIDLLNNLEGKYDMHIISNGFSEVQYTKMENAGISKYFDKIILSDKVGVNKPHPTIFDHAIEVTKAQKDTSLMIGDNYLADITGAAGAGIDQIWYNPQMDSSEIKKATYTVKQLSEIEEILLV